MKKFIAIIILICSLCLLLSACSIYEQGKTFSESLLKSVSLEDMPLPNIEKSSLNNKVDGQETVKAEMSRSEFNLYVESFAAYMRARTDIYYFGLQESDGLIAEMLPHRVVFEVDEDFKCDNDRNWYAFSYSTSSLISEHDYPCDHIRYEEFFCVTMKYDAEKGTAQINITTDPTLGGCIDETLLS